MVHEAWSWKGHVDAGRRLRRRAAFNGSQGLSCCVSRVLDFMLCDVGCAFFFRFILAFYRVFGGRKLYSFGAGLVGSCQ